MAVGRGRLSIEREPHVGVRAWLGELRRHHAEIGAELGAAASRARESRAKLEGFIEHLHARKKAIKAAKRDQQFDLWEAEYADAKASDWAAFIGPASMRT